MLFWILTFFVLAIIAGLLGFTGVQIISLEIARILFFIFLILFIVTVLMKIFRGRPPLD